MHQIWRCSVKKTKFWSKVSMNVKVTTLGRRPLSSLKLRRPNENYACMLRPSVSCWACLLLQHLRRRSLWIIRETDDRWIPRLTWNFSDCSMALRFVFPTQQQPLNCFDVVTSTRTASAAARTPVDCTELHRQLVDAIFRPTFVQKLCYKLPSVVTFTFIQTSKFCILYEKLIKSKPTINCSENLRSHLRRRNVSTREKFKIWPLI